MVESAAVTSPREIAVEVPYAQRGLPKSLGFRWDALSKLWHGRLTGHAAQALMDAGIEVLVEARELAEGFRTAEKALRGDFSVEATNHPSTAPFRHQRAAMAALMAGDAVFLAHEMGTGKTFSTIAALDLLGDEARRVLVICPLSVVPVWGREVERRGAVARRVVDLRRGTVAKKAKVLRQELQMPQPVLAVVNYESAWRGKLGELLLNTEWDMVVLDESHRVKSHKSKVSKFCEKLGGCARRRACLTGTPMPNSPLELFGQMRFLDPSIFGRNYYDFERKYGILGGFEGKKVVAYRGLDDLYARWARVAHRVACEDVLELPPTSHHTVDCEISARAEQVYTDLQEDICARIDEGLVTAANALVELLRLQQITGGSVNTEDGELVKVDDAKQRALTDLLDGLPQAEPVVVFGRFRGDLQAIHEAAYGVGRESVELSGSHNDLEDWQRDDGPPILAVQVQSGGLGVDLSRARYCVYYSLGYSLGDYQQSLARIHRQGQTRHCHYYHLLATMRCGEKTVDHLVYAALGRKQDVVDSVLQKFGKEVS